MRFLAYVMLRGAGNGCGHELNTDIGFGAEKDDVGNHFYRGIAWSLVVMTEACMMADSHTGYQIGTALQRVLRAGSALANGVLFVFLSFS